MPRRSFLRALAGLGGAGLLTGAYAWQVEPFWLEFVRRPLPVAGLPEALTGKLLLQISDLHVGERFDRAFLVGALRRAARLKPDLVVYTGDFVQWEGPRQLRQLAEVFAHAARGRLGSFAVLGNHDYGQRWRQLPVAQGVVDVLSQAGLRVLRNERVVVEGLQILGVDELLSPAFDPHRALASYRPDEPGLLLCHNPDACALPLWGAYRGWILAGHTHGGQGKAPLLPPPLLPVHNKRYVAWPYALGEGRELYINRGLGMLRQVRFNVRPEITAFELRPAPS
jgi:predicted MPP superfamily phosphohydrolase